MDKEDHRCGCASTLLLFLLRNDIGLGAAESVHLEKNKLCLPLVDMGAAEIMSAVELFCGSDQVTNK